MSAFHCKQYLAISAEEVNDLRAMGRKQRSAKDLLEGPLVCMTLNLMSLRWDRNFAFLQVFLLAMYGGSD